MSKQQYDTTIPDFEEMPKPVAVLTQSWEDFYPSAQKYTQEHWNRNPTKEELIGIFNSELDWDCEYSTYWSEVDNAVEKYYEDFCKVCGTDTCELDHGDE